MKKKNNNKLKWNRAHFFKKKKSTPKKVGHPVYVYGTRSRFYKFLTITHTPEKGKEHQYVKLNHNIDPDDPTPAFLKTIFGISRQDQFEDPPKKYRIHDDDKSTFTKYKK